jgi:hypothetical protein
MNKALLLGSLFLRVSSVYGAAAHGDLIMDGRRRNEEAYKRDLEKRGRKSERPSKNPKASNLKSS